MVVDMLFAVAVVALAAGAVAEFQFRIGYIRLAANGATVGVVGLLLRLRIISVCAGEGNNLGGFLLFVEKPSEFYAH